MPASVFQCNEDKTQLLNIEETPQFTVLFTCCHDFQIKNSSLRGLPWWSSG